MRLTLIRTTEQKTIKKGPAIGQALGPLGLNMAEFCKQFNEATKTYKKDVPIPVLLSGKYYYYISE